MTALRKSWSSGRRRGGGEPITLLEQWLEGQSLQEDPSMAKPLFSFRSQVWYNGMHDFPPNPAFSRSFRPYDHIQIFKIYDDNWWIGRVLGQGPACGFIPTPRYFRHCAKGDAQGNKRTRLQSRRRSSADVTAAALEDMFNKHATSLELPEGSAAYIPPETISNALDIYELAPDVRPLVFMGPTKSKSSIARHMRRCLAGYLRITFKDKVGYRHVNNQLLSSRSSRLSRSVADQRSGGPPLARDVLSDEDLTAVHEAASQGQMLILEMLADDPDALRASAMMPIIVYIKIADSKVLSKLISARKKADEPGAAADASRSSSLLSCLEAFKLMNSNCFDVILADSRLEPSCHQLAAFVDAYLGEATMKAEVDARIIRGQRP